MIIDAIPPLSSLLLSLAEHPSVDQERFDHPKAANGSLARAYEEKCPCSQVWMLIEYGRKTYVELFDSGICGLLPGQGGMSVRFGSERMNE